MAKGKTVPFDVCTCGKRGWVDELDAEKALGRAKAKRNRQHDRNGMTRRGMVRENRVYLCHEGELYHLTGQSKRENNAQMAGQVETNVVTLTWESFLEQKVAA